MHSKIQAAPYLKGKRAGKKIEGRRGEIAQKTAVNRGQEPSRESRGSQATYYARKEEGDRSDGG